MSFTKGPWTAKDPEISGEDSLEVWIMFSPHASLASVRRGANDPEYGDDNTVWANAKLIAAAPDLLEACGIALELFSKEERDPKMHAKTREQLKTMAIIALEQAIEKAIGT